MADNSIGRSIQRIHFWNNFVTEKLNTESTDCPEVKEEAVEDEQCCIDMSSPWISCGAVAAGEPLTDPLCLGEDHASGKAFVEGAAEVSSAALAAVQHLADTLTPQKRQEANQEILSTTQPVEQADSTQGGHSLDYDSSPSARLRQTSGPAERVPGDRCTASNGEPDAWPCERVKEKWFSCAACGKRFGKQVHLTLHARIHDRRRPYTCDSCNSEFEVYWQFLSHPCVQRYERPHSCRFCKQLFLSGEGLARHLRKHEADRPFPCAVCGLAFRTEVNLDLHLRTHTGDASGARDRSRADRTPLVCSTCGESFKAKSKLTYHERTTCMLGVCTPVVRLRQGQQQTCRYLTVRR